MGSVLRYTAARLAMFAVALGILYALGARRLLLIALALVISGLASFVLLSKQRDAMSRVIFGRTRDLKERIDTGAAAEDAANEEAARRTTSPEEAGTAAHPGPRRRRISETYSGK